MVPAFCWDEAFAGWVQQDNTLASSFQMSIGGAQARI